jgi:hypothetical protein
MKKFVTLVEDMNTIKESVEEMTATQLAEEMEKTVQKIFPKSYAKANYGVNLGPSITLRFTLGKDNKEYSNGILQNDPAHHILMIQDGLGREGNIVGKLSMEMVQGGYFHTNPDPVKDKYMAMGSHKVGYRKVSGDSKKIITGVKKYFEKLKKELKANEKNIYNYTLKGKF